MKDRRFVTLFASIPAIAAILAIQSCGGVGGTTLDNGGQGSVPAEFLALLSDEQRAASYLTPTDCAGCHGDEDGSQHADWMGTDHFESGITCEGCHGPGSVHKANPSKDNILTLPKIASPTVCAQCHGKIAEEYKFSQHDKLVTSPVERAITGPESYGRAYRCIACHGGTFRTETYDAGVDIATMPAEDIQAIAEGIINHAPHSAPCITCHDPHKSTGYLTDDGDEAQLRHATFNTDTTDVGPGTDVGTYQTFDHLCAQCHNGRGVDPGDAKLQSSTSRFGGHHSNQYNMLMGIGGVEGTGPVERNTAHSNAPGQCSHCHMPDGRHSFTVSFNACVPCHTETDAANRVTSIKSEILSGMYALRVRLANWSIDKFPGVDGNEHLWEYRSYVPDPYTAADQSLIPIEIKRARHNYHYIIESGDFGVHNGPYAKHLITVANAELDSIGAAMPTTMGSVSQAQMEAVIQSDVARISQIDREGMD